MLRFWLNSILISLLPTILLVRPVLCQQDFFRLFGPNSPTIWATYSADYSSIFPIDGGDRVAVVWSAVRPDTKVCEVCYQIVGRFGEREFDEYLVFSNDDMVNGECNSTIDAEGNIFVSWLAIFPDDTTRMFITAQKIAPDGTLEWGQPSQTLVEVPKNNDWDIDYGSTWDNECYSDLHGGIVIITNQGIAAFDSNGNIREGWQGLDEQPSDDFRYRNIVPDGAGGLWIGWWEDNQNTFVYNHLRSNGERIWEDHQLLSVLQTRWSFTGAFPNGVGYNGGIAQVINRNGDYYVIFLDSRANMIDGVNSLRLPDGIQVDNVVEVEPGVMGIVNNRFTGAQASLYLTLIDLENHSFLFGREGIRMAHWGDGNPLNGLDDMTGRYLGRMTDGEYLVKAFLEYENPRRTEYKVFVADAMGNAWRQPLADLTDVGVSSVVSDPTSGGLWVAGTYPAGSYSFYLNRFSFPWARISPTGFDTGIPQWGNFYSYHWFEHGRGSSIFFRTNNGYRMLAFDRLGRLTSPLDGTEILVKRYECLSPTASANVGENLFVMWPDTLVDSGIPPMIAAIDGEGEFIWQHRALEPDNWLLENCRVFVNPLDDAAILMLYRQAVRAPATYLHLIWIDAEDGQELNRFEFSLSSDRYYYLDDVKNFLQNNGDTTSFSTCYRTDSLTTMKFDPYGNPLWDRPVSYNIESHVDEVFLRSDGSLAVCGNYWVGLTQAIPWIDILDAAGNFRETISVYNHPPRGVRYANSTVDWIFSDDNIWFVPQYPLFLNGPDTCGIQMIDGNGDLATVFGWVPFMPDGSIPREWRATSDSSGGIWVVLENSNDCPRILHFSSDGHLTEGWSETGYLSRVDSTEERVEDLFTLSNGDLGLLTTTDYLWGNDWYYNFQRFSLREPDGVDDGQVILPGEFRLDPPFPNPFNERLALTFSLREKGAAELAVFDLTGRMVGKLFEGEAVAGLHRTEWNAAGISSGVYLVRLTAGDESRIRKVVLVR